MRKKIISILIIAFMYLLISISVVYAQQITERILSEKCKIKYSSDNFDYPYVIMTENDEIIQRYASLADIKSELERLKNEVKDEKKMDNLNTAIGWYNKLSGDGYLEPGNIISVPKEYEITDEEYTKKTEPSQDDQTDKKTDPSQDNQTNKELETLKEVLSNYQKQYDAGNYKSIADIDKLKSLGSELRKAKEDNKEALSKYADVLKNQNYDLNILDKCINMINKQIQRLEYKTQTPEDTIDTAKNYVKVKSPISLNEIAGNVVAIGKIAVAIGSVALMCALIVIAIKYIVANPEEKGKLKGQLIGVIVATAVVFGAYLIWDFVYKIAVSIF